MRLKFLILCALLYVSPILISQTVVNYQQYTSENGLSENVVYCIHKDKRGFIWVGTDYGLNRFDGYTFKKYFHNPGDSTSLSNHSVLSIKEDSKGNFWICSYKSLNYFNPETGKAEEVIPPDYNNENSLQQVMTLEGNSIVVIYNNGDSYLYNHEKREWVKLKAELSTSWVSFELFRLKDNRVFLFQRKKDEQFVSVLLLNEKEKRWDTYSLLSIWPFLKEKNPYSYYTFDGYHFIYSLQDQTLRVYNAEGVVTGELPASLKQMKYDIMTHAVEKVDSNLYWIATNKGLLAFDKTSQQITEIKLVGDSKSLAGNKEIRYLVNDKKGSVWIGIFGEGLLRCQVLKSPFKNIPLPELTGEKFLRMIFGLYKWSADEVAAETGFRNFILLKKGKVTRRISADQLSLEDIVMVTTGKSIHQLSAFQKHILKKWYDSTVLYPFRFILRDDTSVINTRYTFTLYQPNDTIASSVQLPGNYIEYNGAYWVTGFNGLYRINKNDFSEEIYRPDINNKWSLSESVLYHLVLDEKNNLWIGSKGGGLNHFNNEENRFYHYTLNDGLPDNVIYCIIPDKNNNLWLTTNKGISRLNSSTKTFTNFSKRDGLLNTEFNRQGGVLMEDGTIFLSGTSGIDYFNPADLPVTVTLPVVHFSELKINNAELTGIKKSSLRHNQNNISLSYTANDFIRPDLVYYRYRLKQNETWTRVQGLNTVLYNALPPGNYRFEVQASYDNLNWSESAVYLFTINQPWWKSRWFYLALSLLTAATLYLIYLYRIRQLKKLYKLRTKISQDLHDEVGATLTSISFLSEVARKQTSNTNEPVVKTLDKIGEYSRDMIGEINDIVWAINPTNDKFDKITDRMKNFALPLLSAKNIRMEFKADVELLNYSIGMEQRKNLYLVFKEAVNNAAKYADCTAIEVNFLKEKSSLVLGIADNGKGFNVDEKKMGNGLKNMELRAKEIKAAFKIQSAPGKGTQILLQMPITQNADRAR